MEIERPPWPDCPNFIVACGIVDRNPEAADEALRRWPDGIPADVQDTIAFLARHSPPPTPTG